MPQPRSRIIGIGNPLHGDDGIGIVAIEQLRQTDLPPGTELLDGGCAGLNLLPYLTGCQRLLIIDAADFSAPPGTIRLLSPAQLEAAAPVTGETLPGLAEILTIARGASKLPPLFLLLVQVAHCRPQPGLSTPVANALPALLQAAKAWLTAD